MSSNYREYAVEGNRGVRVVTTLPRVPTHMEAGEIRLEGSGLEIVVDSTAGGDYCDPAPTARVLLHGRPVQARRITIWVVPGSTVTADVELADDQPV